MFNQNMRRKSVRYSRGNLCVVVKRTGISGFVQKPHIVNWMDFSLYGMSFVSDLKFYLGDKLCIVLAIDDAKQEAVGDIIGIVKNTKRVQNGQYRYGVEFDFEANDYMRTDDVRNGLLTIEESLKNIIQRMRKKHKSLVREL
ncbi:MAG: hypothetical protein E3K37_15045 [Candidatus Kuenenia sp.]|nr:hypothetical protein [Candidatus Kuenenia hertensis]